MSVQLQTQNHYERVLVVGGAGYVGSTIANLHLKQGSKVMVFDDLSSGALHNLLPNESGLIFHKGSITQPQEILAALQKFKPQVVFHMAAIHYIPQCVQDPASVIDINITGTLNLVDALNKLEDKPRLIFTSSASVYGAKTSAPQQVSAVPQPCDIYGYSKMIGEHIVSSRYEKYVIARLFNVFGEKDPIPHLIPSIVRQLDEPVIELGNAESERDFVHVSDAAKAFIALSTQGRLRATYNIGTGTSRSVEEVIRTIKKLSESDARLIFHKTERREIDPPRLCADISDITRDTDWRPVVTFEDGIASVLRHSPRLQVMHVK